MPTESLIRHSREGGNPVLSYEHVVPPLDSRLRGNDGVLVFIVHRSSFIVHRSSFIIHRFFLLYTPGNALFMCRTVICDDRPCGKDEIAFRIGRYCFRSRSVANRPGFAWASPIAAAMFNRIRRVLGECPNPCPVGVIDHPKPPVTVRAGNWECNVVQE